MEVEADAERCPFVIAAGEERRRTHPRVLALLAQDPQRHLRLNHRGRGVECGKGGIGFRRSAGAAPDGHDEKQQEQNAHGPSRPRPDQLGHRRRTGQGRGGPDRLAARPPFL